MSERGVGGLTVDWGRYLYRQQHHYRRYEAYVEREGLTCQECGGRGGEIEPVLDYGQGPWMDCGFCEGTGKTTRWARGIWLRWKRQEKRRKLNQVTTPNISPPFSDGVS